MTQAARSALLRREADGTLVTHAELTVGRWACRMAGTPSPLHLLAHEFQYRCLTGPFWPARWTVVPARAGTGVQRAGQIGLAMGG
jgi:hypothetical protein